MKDKPLLSLILIFLAIVLIDQVSKQWAQATLVDEGFHQGTDAYPACGDLKEDVLREHFVKGHRKDIPVVERFFNFRYVENCASAFGLMSRVSESLRFPFFIIVSVLAVAFIPYLYWKTPRDQLAMLYALPFVLGGAVGNLIDRVVYRYVIDFVDWYIMYGEKELHWPTFNVADAAIVVGIGCMIWQIFPRRVTGEITDIAEPLSKKG